MDPSANYEYQNLQSQQYQNRKIPSSNQPSMPLTNQQVGHPGRPATPRMLRSVSGTLKSSKVEINQQQLQPSSQHNSSAENNSDDPQYITSTNYQGIGSHSRSSSSQQQQYQPQQQPVDRRNPSITHSRTPSVNRYPPSAPVPIHSQQLASSQSQKKQELLPPAAISTPPARESAVVSPASTKAGQPQPQHSQSQNREAHSNHPQQQQQFHRKSIGDWDFVKTIGAGSMGKVKLAQHNSTGEICAVKIVPRAAKLYQRAHANDPPPLNTQVAAQRQKEFEKEIARDKRTIREGALGRLLFHPFICRLYEMVPMTNHYYMLFEYVEGGQMLDYIVSHGSLKEKNARKFARGIASALDYCHKNNVVHRDLKIENIMINQKGDIKIIDFGLSNLYSPKSLLKTYCGSLYFAAPELLSAKPYTGPEVDIWSFGVVLYVLVCGKVPFDDQSVSVLHEKIKRGNVEYPNFLSKECVSLLSRMLVVDPSKRATLYEVTHNPWMNKGYDHPVPSYVPKRIPLSLPLDPEIIKVIASYDLGSVQTIAEELTSILSSVEYQMSCENWYKIIEQGRAYATASNAHILPDPTSGYHPLLSIYYLVDEMRKRKKAKEEAVKAQMEQQSEQREKEKTSEANKLPLQTYQVHPSPTSGQQSQPQLSPTQLQPPIQQVQQNLPPLSFPPQAHTAGSPSTYNRDSESPSTNPTQEPAIPEQQPHSPRESTPTHETLDPNVGKSSGFNSLLRRLSSKKYKNTQSPQSKNNAESPTNPEHNVATPPVPKVEITQESKENLSPQTSFTSSKRDPMVRRGVSMKVTAKEKSSTSRINLHPSTNTDNSQGSSHQQDSLKPIRSADKKPTHNRSSSTSANQNKFHGFMPVEYLPPLPNINANTNALAPPSSNTAKPVTIAASGRKLHPTARAKSVGGHIRKDSYNYRIRTNTQNHQHPPLPNSLATQNSDEIVGGNNNDGFFDDVTLDDIEYQDVPHLTEEQIIEQFNSAKPNSMQSIEYPKTLFLKGFFSVQTTSTKPLPVIRYNIINVLSKLGVKFQEVKGGFICAHTPSLQQSKYPANDEVSTNNSTAVGSQYDQEKDDKTKEEKKLYGDAFKSTSSSIEKPEHPPRTKTPELDQAEQIKTPSRQPSLHLNTHTLSPSSNSSTKSHKSSNSIGGGHRRKFSIGNSILGSYRKKNGSQVMMPPNTPATAKLVKQLYPEEEDYSYDENSKQQRFAEDDSVDSLNGIMVGGGSDMLISSRLEQKAKHQHSSSTSSQPATKKSPLKFEIHIVKVPLVGLYGVQFKKILGNTWNYKTLASRILNELNL